MESKDNQCTCMCLEWMFCDWLLIRFKLMWNMGWLKLGERGGLQIYPRVLGVCPKLNRHGYYPQGICGLNGVSEAIVHNVPTSVTEIGAPRSLFRSSRFLWVFCHHNGLIEVLYFHLMVCQFGRVNPNYSIQSSPFDVAWLIGWTAAKCRAYTPESCQF